MYFGKIKNTEEWGFNVLEDIFSSYIEVEESVFENIMARVDTENKIIKADKKGWPILVNPPDPTPQEKARKKIKELERFLSQTDWYAIRYADTGEEMPAEIKTKRQKAREEISRLKKENEDETGGEI